MRSMICLLPALAAIYCLNHGFATAQEKRPAWTTSRIQGAPVPPEPYRIVPAYPNLRFQLPTCVEEIAGANRLLVTERTGKIFSFPKQADVKSADLVADLAVELTGELASR